MKQTVLVDPQGWTMYELHRIVTNKEALQFLSKRWHGPYKLSIQHNTESNPPQTWIQALYEPTGKITVAAYVRVRE